MICKIALIIFSLFLASLSYASENNINYKQKVDDFLTSQSRVSEFEIKEVFDTESPHWKAVISYVKWGIIKQPVVFFVSSDGQSIVPDAMVFVNNKPIFTKQIQPEYEKVDFKLADKDRITYNPSGQKTVFIFFDPDCPYCKEVEKKLQDYKGEYRVVLKLFPLPMHTEAKDKSIKMQAEWLKNIRKDALIDNEKLIKEAEKIVEEDIEEGQKIGIPGTPFFILEDGTIVQSIF